MSDSSLSGRGPAACLQQGSQRSELDDAHLVLLAAGIHARLERAPDGWLLLVPLANAARAAAELRAARSEAPLQPPAALPGVAHSGAALGVALYLATIWGVWILDARDAFGIAWQRLGQLDAEAVRDGELWRCVTALTLHADIGHLLANSTFGGLFGWFAGRHLGAGFGWLAIVVAAAAANGIDAAIHPDGFRSLGASTANFAALGLVGAYLWIARRRIGGGWRLQILPLGGAVGLLAFVGTGGEDTDLVAHLAGFGCGLVLGTWIGRIDPAGLGRRIQRDAGLVAAGLLVMAWALAVM